ncbi:MAG: DUF2218 domain-containing protein [Kordiimonadaceae bacterium]|nr:DUF2218 domain-containing protein [Kordiimonadaceae bacterium]
MNKSTATVSTGKASRYLQQLCKHWSHNRPTKFDAETGFVMFDEGICRMQATDNELILRISSIGLEHLQLLENGIRKHLERFAFKENPAILWDRNFRAAE